MKRLQPANHRLFYGYQEEADGLGTVNAWKTDEDIIVSMQLPGVLKEDVKIEVQNKTVSIAGERRAQQLQPGATRHRNERTTGRFARLLRLPYQVDTERTTASFRLGVLTLTLRRLEGSKPEKNQRKHRITTAGENSYEQRTYKRYTRKDRKHPAQRLQASNR